MIIYRIIYLIAHADTLQLAFIIMHFYFRAFQNVFRYILIFNYTYFLILLKHGHIITQIYTYLSICSLFNILFGDTHFKL